ncbi:hypothetical protein PYW07_004679 [Mythimna separata]|uniref:Mutant cadherin n=1 Tax=Mythimna separata TaxID=271217 RepID=A0AAD8DXW4_MYTSE|nr:hypothetical protein PYW07_002787 [Mythimna separata]KAJ8720413.1 hypothetical protein PYW07_012456 [Mythimna separata]KAJ8731515.1 hypothetical protein PYW07_004679 [Mythimna separata]
MDNESIIRVCLSAFSEPDIEEAKTLLFESVTTSQRKKSRRRDGKMQRDLEDIICLFKEIDPDVIPTFVARDLQKLPPISFDHIDVTKLLKDIMLLRSEIQGIKEKYASVDLVEAIRLDLENLKLTSLINYPNINTEKRRAYFSDSGPVGLSHDLSNTDVVIKSSVRNALEPSASSTHYRACLNETISLTPRTPVAQLSRLSLSAAAGAPASQQTLIVPKPNKDSKVLSPSPSSNTTASNKQTLAATTSKSTMAEIVKLPGEWKQNKPTEEWTVVQRERHKNRFIGKLGKARTDVETKFKAAETRIPLFISNVNKDTQEADICEYIYNKTKEKVSLEKVIMKKERPYNSFKIFVSMNKIDTFLNDNLWPDGITFRRFIRFKPWNSEKDTTQLNG